jgi:ABC-2 type transport system ATP-binding protein
MTNVTVAAAVKRFGRTRALDGLSLEAGSGITGLLGPNGAGKTTLLRVLATVMSLSAGEVRIFGRNPASRADRLAIRRSLGYMPQEPGFHKNFTAFEFVDYVAILKEMVNRRARHEEVVRVLDTVGLSDIAHKKIKALSGGMRRRVALAQALLNDPELLVLDEPTAGLDPEQRLRFRETMSHLGENHSILLSTHQTEDVAALCSHVVVINHGRDLLSGTPHALAERAVGAVWLSDERAVDSLLSYRTGEGRYRNIGKAPNNAELVQPTVEDGYLMLLGEEAFVEAA